MICEDRLKERLLRRLAMTGKGNPNDKNGGSRQRKIDLINEINPEWRDLIDKL
jgi:hypothetical protein